MADPTKNPVLYLSYDGLTDPLGQSQILPYVIGLTKLGWKFTIISFEKPEALARNRREIENICHQHSIQWLPLSYHKNPPVLSTLYDLWRLSVSVKSIVKQNPNTIIHCRSYLTSLVTWQMKRRFKTKFIFDMRGFWADERVEGGLWNLSNPLYRMIYRFFKKKEKEFLVDAEHVISLTHNAKQEIESWKIGTAPISVIPTCVDLDLFNPDKIKIDQQNKLRQDLGLKETDYVLLYLGSWGTWYLTEEMLKYFSELKKLKPEARFLIVTPDEVDLSHHEYYDDIVVTRASRPEVPLFISIANASIFFLKPSFSKKASSATKLGELLAMKRMVITNSGWGDVDQFNYGNWVHVMDVTKPFSFDWITSQPTTTIDLETLSLTQGILRYNNVYNCL
jgi:glycosyltransferase involved in cell wall biosynthesis